MKISKIPGLGRFGVYIDDIDLKTISHDEWMEIGKIHLKSTLYNRRVESEEVSRNRVGYRVQYDYNNLVETHNPFYQEEFNHQRPHRLELLKIATTGMFHAN